MTQIKSFCRVYCSTKIQFTLNEEIFSNHCQSMPIQNTLYRQSLSNLADESPHCAFCAQLV